MERDGVLRLENNAWVMPPEAVVEAGVPAVKRYLLDVQEAEKAGADVTSLKLLIVVLVGSASAGKTRWVTERYKGMLAHTVISQMGTETTKIYLLCCE